MGTNTYLISLFPKKISSKIKEHQIGLKTPAEVAYGKC